MAYKDLLQRFIFENIPVRGEFIHLDDSYQTIVNQHPYPPALRSLLGEALCVAGLLSAIIKFEGRLTIQFRGTGKLKLLLAQSDNQFNLRGLAKWEGEMSEAELTEALQEGILAVMIDSGPGKQYQGMVAWRGNSLTESIEGYFKDSEQLPTKIWLAVDEKSAAGFLLQIVPAADKNLIAMEQAAIHPHLDYLTNLSKEINDIDLLYIDYQEFLKNFYPNEEIRIFPDVPVAFGCTCSRSKSEDAIYLLGKEEAEEEIRNKNSLVVTCDFCNQEYVFDKVDVAEIFERKSRPADPSQLH